MHRITVMRTSLLLVLVFPETNGRGFINDGNKVTRQKRFETEEMLLIKKLHASNKYFLVCKMNRKKHQQNTLVSPDMNCRGCTKDENKMNTKNGSLNCQ